MTKKENHNECDSDSNNNSLSKNEYRRNGIKWEVCCVLRLIFVSFRIKISRE